MSNNRQKCYLTYKMRPIVCYQSEKICKPMKLWSTKVSSEEWSPTYLFKLPSIQPLLQYDISYCYCSENTQTVHMWYLVWKNNEVISAKIATQFINHHKKALPAKNIYFSEKNSLTACRWHSYEHSVSNFVDRPTVSPLISCRLWDMADVFIQSCNFSTPHSISCHK